MSAPASAGSIAASNALASSGPPGDTSDSQQAVSLSSAVAAASRAFNQQHYRTAAAICTDILQQYPTHTETSLLLSRTLLAAGQPQAAEEVLPTVLQCTATANRSVELLRQLGICQFAIGKHDEAVETFQTAAALPNIEGDRQLELQALTASVLQTKGGVYAEVAASLMLDVLQQDPQQFTALKWFAMRAVDQGDWESAGKVVLQLLTLQPDDKQVQQLLLTAAQQPDCLQHIIGLIGETSRSPTALVFVGKALQKQGAVPAALQLYRRAVQLQPGYVGAALGLVQVLEAECDYISALTAVLTFCRADGQVRHSGCEALLLKNVELVLNQLLSSRSNLLAHPLVSYQPCTCGHGSQHDSSNSSSSGDSSMDGLVADMDSISLKQTHPNSTSTSSTSSSCSSSTRLIEMSQGGSSNSQQLDLLALIFTTAKILFCCGAVDPSLQLLQCCDDAVDAITTTAAAAAATTTAAAADPLHLTHIRNEAAYANYIRLLLQECPPGATALQAAAAAAPGSSRLQYAVHPTSSGSQHMLPLAAAAAAAAGIEAAQEAVSIVAAAADTQSGVSTSTVCSSVVSPPSAAVQESAKPVYLCGDSHCLSGAWRIITINNDQRLVCPLLVTGLKIWHLSSSSSSGSSSSGSSSTQHHQFWRLMRSLPCDSDVIVVVGEVDCREGMVNAVEKMKYSSLEEAISATVAVYTTVLKQLVTHHNLNIYIHPIPPVLDETREIVLHFESALQQAVQQLRQTLSEDIRCRLQYLDFSRRLLQFEESGGPELRHDLQLDGSHLHPRYLQYLEKAMNKAGC